MESGREMLLSDNDVEYDFLIDVCSVEVGGKKKESKNAQFDLRNNINIPDVDIIHLRMLGVES